MNTRTRQLLSVAITAFLVLFPQLVRPAIYKYDETIPLDYTHDYAHVDQFERTLGHHEYKKIPWPWSGYWKSGHTLEKHVGKSEKWLINRCKEEPHIPMAGSYRYMSHAHKIVRQMVKDQTWLIQYWLNLTDDGSNLPESTLRSVHFAWLENSVHGGLGRGYGCKRINSGRDGAYHGKLDSAILRVRHSTRYGANFQDGRWFIVTSYPIKSDFDG